MFADKIVQQPLLTDAEINQLIFAAPQFGQGHSGLSILRGQPGSRISSQKGSGGDFADLRSYHPGDELRHIDWRATARSRVPLVRTYLSELSQPICFVIDRRASMRFATRCRLKAAQALRMALWLGGRELRHNRPIASVIMDSRCHWLPPQQGLRSLNLMTRLANAPCPPIDSEPLKSFGKSPWQAILSGLRQNIAQGSEVILLSDFFGLQDTDGKLLRSLGQHCSATAIHILDPSEMSLSFRGTLKLQWRNMSRYLSSAPASHEMNLQLQNRRKALSERLERANISYYRLSVELDELSGFGYEEQS